MESVGGRWLRCLARAEAVASAQIDQLAVDEIATELAGDQVMRIVFDNVRQFLFQFADFV